MLKWLDFSLAEKMLEKYIWKCEQYLLYTLKSLLVTAGWIPRWTVCLLRYTKGLLRWGWGRNNWKLRHARIQRGTGVRTPWDLPEVGSCVDVWWVGEGVQRFLSYYFFDSLRSPLLWNKCLKNLNHFQVQNIIFSPRSSYKISGIHSGFHECAFSCYFV